LAYADALGQDADAVFRVSKVEKMDEQTKVKRTELFLTAPGLREGKFEGIIIHGAPATNFGYIKTMLGDDVNSSYEEQSQKSRGGGTSYRGTFNKPFEARDPKIRPR
jgi:hypothetical protein